MAIPRDKLFAKLCKTVEHRWDDTVVVPFGSYAMRTDTEASDIDCVCISSKLTRDAYFTEVKEWLAAQVPLVTDVVQVDAKVSLLQFKLAASVEVDMSFAKLPAGITDFYPDSALEGMDAESILSLSGARVARYFGKYGDSFREALKYTKSWATVRGIYNSRMGYLGGIHLSVMLGCCMPTTKISSKELVKIFFETYQDRKAWEFPLRLTEYYRKGPCQDLVWDPMSNTGHHKQPVCILTPVYPFTNIAANVTASTFARILWELKRAAATMNTPELMSPATKIIPQDPRGPIDKRVSKKNTQCIKMQSGPLIDSRIVGLIRLLESTEGIEIACPAKSEDTLYVALWFRNDCKRKRDDSTNMPKKTIDISGVVARWRQSIPEDLCIEVLSIKT